MTNSMFFCVDRIGPEGLWAPRRSPKCLCPDLRQSQMSGDLIFLVERYFKRTFYNYLIFVEVDKLVQMYTDILYSLIALQIHV